MTDAKPQHPTVQIANIKLEPFEKAVYSRQYEDAGQMLIDMLRKLRVGAAYIGYRTDQATMAKLHTRFAAAVFTLLADPKFELSAEGFTSLCAEHSVIDLVFRASAFDTSDHMLPQIADVPDPENPGKLQFGDSLKLIKYLLSYSMRSSFSLRFREIFSKSPQTMFALYIGMLAHLLTLNEKAQERREELLMLADVFDDRVLITDKMLPMLADAYMYTSYGLGPQRHTPKAVIHRLCAKMIHAHKVPLPTRDQLKNRRELCRNESMRGKPIMVIPLDWFTTLHAMYRCWVPAIRQLRGYFHLVAFSQASAIDDEAKKEFDEWCEVPVENIALSTLVKQITDFRPDIIYYPSVGMTLWWIVMSSLRLAPIQVMTLGHPASSFSPAMDYVIGDAGTFTDSELFSERVVELPEGSLFKFAMRPDAEFPPMHKRGSSPTVVKIAVPAMLCKLNSAFMRVLKEIKEKAATPVEFHFFPNMSGITLHQTAKELRDWLPGAYVYERNEYNQYLTYMSQCDMTLCTFPFGGTNSNIDSMKLGLPLIAMEGAEPFERMDAIMLRKVGLPEWCVAQGAAEYVAAALRLIDDHAERLRLREFLLAAPIEEVFFGTCENQHFGNAMRYLYDNHEAIQASKERVVKL